MRRRSCVHAAPRPRANQPRLDQIPVGSGDGISMQAEQFLGASNAGKSSARPDLAAENARFQVTDELSAKRYARSAVEDYSVQYHDRQSARQDQASVNGSRIRRTISPANPMHATPTTTWIPYVPG